MAEPKKVFLSWSGEKSHRVARALMKHLARLSTDIEAWESADLPPGREWARHLMAKIEDADLAIFCLTRRNLSAPWVTFELGAFYRNESDRPSIPYLLDVTAAKLDFPTQMFQAKEADYPGTLQVFSEVGALVGMDSDAVDAVFHGTIWDELESQLEAIRKMDEQGDWVNIANAYFLGHDLRWTLAQLDTGANHKDIAYGLRQCLHHAEELGAGLTEEFLMLNDLTLDVLETTPEEWDASPDTSRVRAELQRAYDHFSSLVKSRQPGYVSAPADNADLRIKMKRRHLT